MEEGIKRGFKKPSLLGVSPQPRKNLKSKAFSLTHFCPFSPYSFKGSKGWEGGFLNPIVPATPFIIPYNLGGSNPRKPHFLQKWGVFCSSSNYSKKVAATIGFSLGAILKHLKRGSRGWRLKKRDPRRPMDGSPWIFDRF